MNSFRTTSTLAVKIIRNKHEISRLKRNASFEIRHPMKKGRLKESSNDRYLSIHTAYETVRDKQSSNDRFLRNQRSYE